MDALRDFLAMGGYGAYVWSAWGLTFLVLGGLFGWTLWLGQRRQRELEALERRLTQGQGSRRRLRPVRAERTSREDRHALP